MKNEKAKTVVGDIGAPVFAYIGESGSGKDRRIKLEGPTIFDKLLDLYKAGTYVSIGPAEGSRAWNKLDKEDQSDYRILQARAKKKTTYKQMGDFLADMCAANECFLFAIRQGDDAVWVNPKALKELLDTPWHGVDSVWLDQAADVKGYWDKVIAARDAGKDYSKIKPEGKANEADYGNRETKELFPAISDAAAIRISPMDGKIFIPAESIRKALRAGGASEGLLSHGNYDSAIITELCESRPLGKADIEYPRDGGYSAGIHMNPRERLETDSRFILQAYVENVLDFAAGAGPDTDFAGYGEYGLGDVMKIASEAAADSEVAANLRSWNVEPTALAGFVGAPLSPAAYRMLADELMALDNTVEKE